MQSAIRQGIARWIATHPWAPSILFVLAPASCIAAIYGGPETYLATAAAVIALLLFAGFVTFLTLYRREDRGSLGSSVPTLFGPLCAQWYVSIKNDEPLLQLLHSGGDVLIQLAFFVAGLIGLVVYQYSAIWEIKGDEVQRKRASLKAVVLFTILFALLVVMMIPAFSPIGEAPLPRIFGWIQPPPATPLTMCRIALALVSVLIATWPRHQSSPHTESASV